MAKTKTAPAKASGGKMTYYFGKTKTEGRGLPSNCWAARAPTWPT